MNRQGKAGAALVAGSFAFLAAAGVTALAGTNGADEGIPPGPRIDFCPTTEQIEAHLEEYGFDYKPTVVCGENGEELGPSEPVDEEAEEAKAELRKSDLLSATRVADNDGDPLTMEIVLKDGTEATIDIDGDPKIFKDMTPAELAEVIYP